MKYIQEILPCLKTMLDFNDLQIKADTCRALSYITDGPTEGIQYVLNVSMKRYLVILVRVPSKTSVTRTDSYPEKVIAILRS